MERVAIDVRQRYLAVSGGWLGSLVIAISNALGIFDTIVLFIVGVIWYQVVRSSGRELAIILGLYIDGSIPMQYYMNEAAYAAHKEHLDDYWPLFFMGTMAEAGMYLLLDPFAFTFVVCLKSLAFCMLWMGRREDGVFLSTALRKGKAAKPSVIPVGGMDFADNPKPLPTVTPSPIILGPNGLPPFWFDPRHPQAEEQLRAKYPDDLARWGMMYELCSMDDERAKDKLEGWLTDPASRTLAKKMSETATDAQESGRGQQGPALLPGARPPDMPIAPDYPHVEQDLRELYPDEWARWGMMHILQSGEGEMDPAARLKMWMKEVDKAPARGIKFANEARQRVATLPPDQQVSSIKALPNSLPPIDGPNRIGMNLARADQWLRALYSDPIVRMGMLETYRSSTNEETAERQMQTWATQPQGVPANVEEFSKRGRVAQQWRRDLRNSRVPVFVDDDSIAFNDELKPLFANPWTRYGLLTSFIAYGKSNRRAKVDAALTASTLDEQSALLKSAGQVADQVQDLFNDEGWVMKQNGWVQGDAVEERSTQNSNWKAAFREAGGDRGGKGVGDELLARLKRKMGQTDMRYAETAKILDVFSRPRCQSQERAALARLNAYGIGYKIFVLPAEAKAAVVERYRSTVDPETAKFLSEQLREGLSVDNFENPRAIDLLNASSHTKEDMIKVGKIIGSLGFNIAGKPLTSLAFFPDELFRLRLKLLKMYDQDHALVDVMMAHVTRAPNKDEADRRANTMIQAGIDKAQAVIKAQFRRDTDKLEVMRTELGKYFDPGIVGGMRAVMLSKDPSGWDSLYAEQVQLTLLKETDRAAYDAKVDEYRGRGADEAYYKDWKPIDAEKRGRLSVMFDKVPETLKQIFK